MKKLCALYCASYALILSGMAKENGQHVYHQTHITDYFQPGHHYPPPPHIHINVAPQQHTVNRYDEQHHVVNDAQVNAQAQADAQAEADAHAEAEVEVRIDLQATIEAYLTSCQTAMQTLWHEYHEPVHTTFIDNKGSIAIASILTGYAYLCYQAYTGNCYLRKPRLWSSWNKDLSFEELCDVPQQELAHELLFTIQHRHINPEDPLDVLDPMTHFLHEIEQEKELLHYYNTLYTRIKFIKLSRLFPFKRVLYDEIPLRIQRLAFVKNTFISWIAECKVQNSTIAH